MNALNLLACLEWTDDIREEAARQAAITLADHWADIHLEINPADRETDIRAVADTLREWLSRIEAHLARAYACPRCGTITREVELKIRWPNPVLVSLLAPGDTVPAGACPKCNRTLAPEHAFTAEAVALPAGVAVP